jgi:hypothetical protein
MQLPKWTQAKTKAKIDAVDVRGHAPVQRVAGKSFGMYHSNAHLLTVTLTTAITGRTAQDHGLIADRAMRPAIADPKATGHVDMAMMIISSRNSNSLLAVKVIP